MWNFSFRWWDVWNVQCTDTQFSSERRFNSFSRGLFGAVAVRDVLSTASTHQGPDRFHCMRSVSARHDLASLCGGCCHHVHHHSGAVPEQVVSLGSNLAHLKSTVSVKRGESRIVKAIMTVAVFWSFAATSTSETSSNFCQTRRRSNPQDNRNHGSHRKNLKSHSVKAVSLP